MEQSGPIQRRTASVTSFRHTPARSSITSPNTSGLPTLPLELFENILDSVDDKDVINIRQTCRECETKSLQVFAKRFFSHRSVSICDERGLKNAVQMAREDVFGSAIKSIDIYAEELPEWNRIKGAYWSEDEQKERKKQWDAARPGRRYSGIERFPKNKYLEDLFNAIGPHQNLASITIKESERCREAMEEWRDQAKPQDPLNLAPLSPENEEPFVSIICAMAEAKLKPTRLIVDSAFWYLPLHSWRYFDSFFSNLAKVCERIVEAAVSVWMTTEFHPRNCSMLPYAARDFLRALTSSQQLRSLRINVPEQRRCLDPIGADYYDEYMDCSINTRDKLIVPEIMKLRIPKLERFVLTGEVETERDDLRKFVGAHSTLQFFELPVFVDGYPSINGLEEEIDYDGEEADWSAVKSELEIPDHVEAHFRHKGDNPPYEDCDVYTA